MNPLLIVKVAKGFIVLPVPQEISIKIIDATACSCLENSYRGDSVEEAVAEYFREAEDK